MKKLKDYIESLYNKAETKEEIAAVKELESISNEISVTQTTLTEQLKLLETEHNVLKETNEALKQDYIKMVRSQPNENETINEDDLDPYETWKKAEGLGNA